MPRRSTWQICKEGVLEACALKVRDLIRSYLEVLVNSAECFAGETISREPE